MFLLGKAITATHPLKESQGASGLRAGGMAFEPQHAAICGGIGGWGPSAGLRDTISFRLWRFEEDNQTLSEHP